MGDMVMEDNKERPLSQIIITFAYPGSAEMDIQFVGVSPLQAAAAAWLLDKQAEVGFVQQEAQRQQKEQMNHIAVPGGVRAGKKL